MTGLDCPSPQDPGKHQKPQGIWCRTKANPVDLVQRFIREGCPNCEAFLDLTNHPDSVQECTSQVFEGLITLQDPAQSWVARWQRLDGYVSGVYAVKVVGTVSCWFWKLFSTGQGREAQEQRCDCGDQEDFQ